MIKRFWYCNAAITLIAVLILIVGLDRLSSLDADSAAGKGIDKSTLDGQDSSGASNSAADSALVAAVKAYSERWRPKGAVQVIIQPESVLAKQSKWRIKDGLWWNLKQQDYQWQDPNTIVENLRADENRSVTIEFQDVEGWIKPSVLTARVVKNQVTTLTGRYKLPQPMGMVTVAIAPREAVMAKMRWRVDSNPWQNSGAKIEAAVGTHTISFSPFTGWTSPSAITVTIQKDQTTETAGTYIEKPKGLLQVVIEPNQVISEAKWRYAGGAWQKSDVTLDNIMVGSYPLEWSNVTGWDTPEKTTIVIEPNEVTQVLAIYEAKPRGGIRVTLGPDAAVQAQAQWKLDTGAWQNSGVAVNGIIVGAHTLSVKPLADWIAPQNQTINITEAHITEVTLVYKSPPPPKPTFLLKATLIVGRKGMAWIQLAGQTKPEIYFLGEDVALYKIIEIYDGFINVMRQGHTFKLEVPEPTPIGQLKPPPAKTLPDKRAKPKPPTPPRRTYPPRPSSVQDRMKKIQEERAKRK